MGRHFNVHDDQVTLSLSIEECQMLAKALAEYEAGEHRGEKLAQIRGWMVAFESMATVMELACEFPGGFEISS